MCSKRGAAAMLAFCWQIYICRDKPRARGKCAQRSGGTGLKISCWLPGLYAALSFSLSHALCHRALACLAPPCTPSLRVCESSPMKGFPKNWSLWKVAKAACASINLGLLERVYRWRIPAKDKWDGIGTHLHQISARWVIISINASAAFELDPIPVRQNIYLGRCSRFSNVSVESCRLSGFPCMTLEWQSECVILCYHPQCCCHTAGCKTNLQEIFLRFPTISLLKFWAGLSFNRILSWPERNVTSEPPLRRDQGRSRHVKVVPGEMPLIRFAMIFRVEPYGKLQCVSAFSIQP